MKLYDFSDKTVEQAKAALTLKFDCVEKYEIAKIIDRTATPRAMTTRVRLLSVQHACEIDSSLFPELQPGDNINLNYIVNHKAINKKYRDDGLAE